MFANFEIYVIICYIFGKVNYNHCKHFKTIVVYNVGMTGMKYWLRY